MTKGKSIIPTSDGCSVICPVDVTFQIADEAQVTYKYDAEGLVVEYSTLQVKIPHELFEYLQRETLVEDPHLGWVTNLHLYGEQDEYLGYFMTTVQIPGEEMIKAKGVAAYLASNPT